MSAFNYKKGELYCEGLKVKEIIETVGTPCYLYSHQILIDNYQVFNEAFTSVKHLVCYAVKTNASLSILRTLANLGAGADIVSAGELYRALTAGFKPEKIVFAGVGKTEDEIYLSSIPSSFKIFNSLNTFSTASTNGSTVVICDPIWTCTPTTSKYLSRLARS